MRLSCFQRGFLPEGSIPRTLTIQSRVQLCRYLLYHWLVEAQKRLYQGLPVTQRASRRVFVPVLAPQGVPSTRTKLDQQKTR